MLNYIAATAAGKGQRLARVNMDETMVCLFQEPGRGIVLTKVPQRCRVPGRLNVSRAVRRTNLTYTAFVSDDPDFQAALPHIIVGNGKTFSEPGLLTPCGQQRLRTSTFREARRLGIMPRS